MTAPRQRRTGVRALAVTSVILALLGVMFAGPVQAHHVPLLGHDSVDDCEIRWEDETSWDTERQAAQAEWEFWKLGDNCVDLAPDAWNTNADLEWKDANRSDVSWAGLYQWEFGADDIHLNAYYMQGYGSCKRKWVAMHELGHAHGLDHSSFVKNDTGNIMNKWAINVCALRLHDIADYRTLWG